ncbi:TetR family transcriptional regulator, partial [Streptomyces sp. NPDC096012]|uniref:TetR family transcriptional regulator n=1 Tax=Streptomyces sp. NPDC096012 TaxID=3155684 RepID=UPI003369DD99
GPLPAPRDLVRAVRDRAVTALRGPGRGPGAAPAGDELTRSCELVVRLALSFVAAPPEEDGMAELVRAVLPRQPV